MWTSIRRSCFGLSGAALALLACSPQSSSPPGPVAGKDAGTDTAPIQADTAPRQDVASEPGKADVPAEVAPASATAYFVKQSEGSNTATLEAGTISVTSAYSASGNAFKYVAPNYYGTSSNGFIALPTPMSGDFSISAEVTVTTQNKSNNACGIGVGITTGFNPTDAYAYVLMRNSNNSTSGYYVNGSGTTSAGSPTASFSNGTPLALSFSRSGKNVTLSAGPLGGSATSTTLATSSLTDGSNVYGDGPVYPAVSFNNVVASIAKLVIKDGDGKVVFDSSTGTLVNYVPAALTLSAASVSVAKGASATVSATANAVGGDKSTVTATSADTSIATVEVKSSDTGATITIAGLKGGVTTIAVKNDADPSATTGSKTILVAVNDYPATDDYGSKALPAYPAPGATAAFPDGELALTFDSPPKLNQGGSIKLFKLADGTEVDSIAFADESQTYGSTVIKVGSQLVRVDGNTVYITPHLGRIAYGADYYVAIPTTSITGTVNGAAFNGLSNSSKVATWRFTTKAAPTLDFDNVTVDGAQSSTASFRSLAAALMAVASNAAAPANVTLKVAAGNYHELLRYSGPGSSANQTVRIVGPSGNRQGDTCVFEFANGNNVNGSTQTRPTFYFTGANLVLENITLKNSGARSVYAQAETLYFASGGNFTLAAYNSTFISNQDTVQTSGRNWFYKCNFEGNVDFLWGTAQAALFESCNLHVVNDQAGNAASYSLVVARTGSTVTGDGTVGKGYVVLGSTVTVDANTTATLGRNAGGGAWYDQAAFVDVTFTGAGSIGAGLWSTTNTPASMGDASYVGWKSAGCTGLNLSSLTTASGTSATIADQTKEYDTRDHILNRVVTIKSGAPVGYEAVSSAWDVSALASTWGAR